MLFRALGRLRSQDLQERGLSEAEETPGTGDRIAIADMMIVRAREVIDEQLRGAEVLASKALGLLAVDAGAIALLVTVHTDLSRYWTIPTAALGVAGIGFLWAVWPAKLDSGPDPEEFFESFGGGFELETKLQFLSDLIATGARNRRDSREPTKNQVFKLAFWLLVIALIGSLAVALTGSSLQFP